MRFFIFDDRRTMRTDPHAGTAADTFAFTDMRFAVMVHFHFAGTRTAAHTDIFNSAAETSSFVTFKMVQEITISASINALPIFASCAIRRPAQLHKLRQYPSSRRQ